MTKKTEDVIDIFETKKPIAENVNTTASIRKPATDEQLQKEEFKKASSIVGGTKKKFKCSSVYAPLYPDGFTTTYQGIVINLIFDNRVVEMSEAIVDFVEDKIQKKADKEAAKLNQFQVKKQDLIGEFTSNE